MSKQVELVQGAVDALRATQEVLLSGKCAALTVVAVTADGQVIQHRLFTNNVPMTTVHLGLLSMEHHIATEAVISISQREEQKRSAIIQPQSATLGRAQ